jgi:hypothetical protein
MSKYSDESITFFLFEATSISSTMLKDNMRFLAKHWFNKWWKTGLQMFKELNTQIKNKEFGEEAECVYDDKSAEIYELVKLYLEIDNFELAKNKLKELL